MNFQIHEEVAMKITGLTYEGMGIGEDATGRRAFVWNALVGEEVVVEIMKYKRGNFYGIATTVNKPSSDRVAPKEEYFLSSSPWQIMSRELERKSKTMILSDVFRSVPATLPEIGFIDAPLEYGYRTKMEFGFHAEPTLSLAGFDRMGRGRIRIKGSALATDMVNNTAQRVVDNLVKNKALPQVLKSLIVRANSKGETVVALFVINEKNPLDENILGNGLVGVSVYFSDPQSPASVPTKFLGSFGKNRITETIRGREFEFEILSFMQVNVPVFEKTLDRISSFIKNTSAIVDMYSGVGSIGLSVDVVKRTLVEIESTSVACARANAERNGIVAEIIESPSERAYEYISADATLILDPPRVGLHPKIIKVIKAVKPQIIVYLSCNPKTQGRDLIPLVSDYEVVFMEGYNFFPRTPHVECLVILKKK